MRRRLPRADLAADGGSHHRPGRQWQDAAHTIKGSAAAIGAFRLAAVAQRAETIDSGDHAAREAALAKELTKLHERVARGTLDKLISEIEPSTELKGEFVVVIAPPSQDKALIGDEAIVAELKQALQEESFRDAVRSVAERFKLKRSHVYELGLALQRQEPDPE